VRSFTQSEQAADPVALAEPACIAAGQRLAGPQIESIKACRAHRLQRPTSHHCSQVALHPPRSSCAKTVAKQQTWLTTAPPMSRVLGITHVTIDLSASYAKAVREALPDAVLVADRYHLVQLANDMLTQVRQRVIRETEGRRGRKTDPAWAARRRLLTGHERLRPETFAKMWNSLIDTGDTGVLILQAYTVKEELRSLLSLAGTNPERHIIRTRLDSFYQQAAATDAPEAHRLAATVEAWWPAIEAGLLTGYSNSRSEGYNRLAKHQGRNAFGFRNPVNQRRRIRWSCTRQYRRTSAARSTLPA
jgi:transposase